MKLWKSESELAKVVIEWLQDYGWEVYQEVQLERYGKTADIIAKQNGLIWVIECKLSNSLSVIEQAEYWSCFAHYSSVAVPYSRDSKIFDKVLKWLGIGKICPCNFGTSEEIKSVLHRKSYTKIWDMILSEDHKTFAEAGNSSGEKLTPFTRTCRDILYEVKKSPGLTIKDLLEKVKTHYRTPSTARSCILKWAELGKIKGVKVVRENNRIKFYAE